MTSVELPAGAVILREGGERKGFFLLLSGSVQISVPTQTPPAVWLKPLPNGPGRPLASPTVPAAFPAARLVLPEHVTFTAPDGLTIHRSCSRQPGGTGRSPAVVFVHGGPPRQMLLGWH